MFKCIGYSVFINRSCNNWHVPSLRPRHSIATPMAAWRSILTSFPPSPNAIVSFQANAEVIDDFVDTLLFGISFGGDIGKGGNQRPICKSGWMEESLFLAPV